MSYPDIGFPDYSRLTPQGGRYLATLHGDIDADPATDPISSTGFGYITLITYGETAGVNYLVIVNWGYGSDPALRFTSTQYTPSSGNTNIVTFPIIGEWFTVEYLWISGNTGVPVTTLIYGTNAPPVMPPLGCGSQGYINEFVSIAGGATDSFYAPGCHQGRAKVCISDGIDNKWNCNILYYSPTAGAWEYLYSFNGSVYGQSTTQEIALPPSPIQLQVTNLDAAAVNFIVTMVPI